MVTLMLSIYLSIYLFIHRPRVNTYIIEMLGCFHDVRSSLVLVILHPALAKELPVEKICFHKNQKQRPTFNVRASLYLSLRIINNVSVYTYVCVLTHMGWPWRPGGPAVWVAQLSPGQSGSQMVQFCSPPEPGTNAHNCFYRTPSNFKSWFRKSFCNVPLTICKISSRVTWLSPGSSWVRVLCTKRQMPHYFTALLKVAMEMAWPYQTCLTLLSPLLIVLFVAFELQAFWSCLACLAGGAVHADMLYQYKGLSCRLQRERK